MTFLKTKLFWHKTLECNFFYSYRYSKMSIENAIYKCISCVQIVHIVHSGVPEFIPGFCGICVAQITVFCIVFRRPFLICLFFILFVWLFYCLSYDLQLLITLFSIIKLCYHFVDYNCD